MKQSISLILLVIGINTLFAQDKVLLKTRKLLETKQWAKARSKAESVVEEDKSAVEYWYIKAAAEFEMSKLDKYRGGKVNYFKELYSSDIQTKAFTQNTLIQNNHSSNLSIFRFSSNCER